MLYPRTRSPPLSHEEARRVDTVRALCVISFCVLFIVVSVYGAAFLDAMTRVVTR